MLIIKAPYIMGFVAEQVLLVEGSVQGFRGAGIKFEVSGLRV